jgi:DNA-binding NarL/FixJ family response regulator
VIRVLIADDHVMVRSALARLLDASEDIEVVGQANDGGEAVAMTHALSPDVVLMDLVMPGTDGGTATRVIRDASPGVQVVVLTSLSGRDDVVSALDAGATGYLLKDATIDQLLDGVRAAARNESPLTPRAASELLAARRTASDAAPALSDREREVLDLLADGLPNKVIARRLGIAERTVKAHVSRIFAALGVTDRTQAAIWAQRHTGPASSGPERIIGRPPERAVGGAPARR